jgi:plasmid stabilization system protein ParE
MPFTVSFKRKAQRDLEESLAWWSKHGKAAAAEWRERFIVKVISTLEQDPLRFPSADEAAELGLDLRVMLYGRRRQVYRVLFTVEANSVFIHRVRHASQDWLKEVDL